MDPVPATTNRTRVFTLPGPPKKGALTKVESQYEQSAKGRHSRFFKNEQFAFSLKTRYQSQKRYLAL